jgi:hypothetical protein
MGFGYGIKMEGLADLLFFERVVAQAKFLLLFLKKIHSKMFIYSVNGKLF